MESLRNLDSTLTSEAVKLPKEDSLTVYGHEACRCSPLCRGNNVPASCSRSIGYGNRASQAARTGVYLARFQRSAMRGTLFAINADPSRNENPAIPSAAFRLISQASQNTRFQRIAFEASRRSSMQDAIWIAVTVAFFVLSVAYVHFCDRVK